VQFEGRLARILFGDIEMPADERVARLDAELASHAGTAVFRS
jgi:hypothetical protein